MSRGAACRAWLLAAIVGLATATGVARAQHAAPDPASPPQPVATVRDPDFGVIARHVGLARDVEMYQWQRRGDGYERAWNAQALDSSGFAPGHGNPPFPLRSRQWLAGEVRVDGVPLDPAILQKLGRWVPFRPSFNALPGNLAVTFQPQGDGLGTAGNPMAPQVGDLRIHWRELRLPPLRDRIVLEAGHWRLDPAASAGASPGAGARVDRAAADAPARGIGNGFLVAGLLVVLLVFAVAFGMARLLRRRR